MEEDRQPATYIVFSCPKCQRYTYAKETQKNRVCGYCGKKINLTNIQGKPVIGVHAAHQLALEKDHELLSRQQIAIDITSSLKLKAKSHEGPTFSRDELFTQIDQFIQQECQVRGIQFDATIPESYLKLLFEHATQKNQHISFEEYCKFFYNQQRKSA
jgi:hypothetical protein